MKEKPCRKVKLYKEQIDFINTRIDRLLKEIVDYNKPLRTALQDAYIQGAEDEVEVGIFAGGSGDV